MCVHRAFGGFHTGGIQGIRRQHDRETTAEVGCLAKAVIPFLLAVLVLFAPSLAVSTALAATVSWVTPPPSSIASGQSFTVSWRVSGASSFDANVHWDPSNPGGPGRPRGDISPACNTRSITCTTLHEQGVTTTKLTAPTISPTGVPVVVKYLVHIRVPAGGRTHTFTDARSVTITPAPGPPTLTIGVPSIDFGHVQAGSCETTAFALQHAAGTRPASGTVSVGPSPPFSLPSGNSFSVLDGQGVDIEVRFCPTDEGSFLGEAIVNSPGTSFTNTNTETLQGIAFKPPVPATPTALTATALSTSTATLAWQGISSNAEGFRIARKTGTSGTYRPIGTQGVERPFFTDSGLSDSTTYCYRVRAYNAAGDSAASNEACITTPSLSSAGQVTRRGGEAAGVTSNRPESAMSTPIPGSGSYSFPWPGAGPYRNAPGGPWCGPLLPFPYRFRPGW